jgi:hypothetical protein
MNKKLRNQPYAPKWEQEEKKNYISNGAGYFEFPVYV